MQIKSIGKSKNNFIIRATSFNGEQEITIITPKNPTQKEIEETKEFLLGELDDHDAYTKYLELLGEAE